MAGTAGQASTTLSAQSMLLGKFQPDLRQIAGIDDGGMHTFKLPNCEQAGGKYHAICHSLTWRDHIFCLFLLSDACLLCLVVQRFAQLWLLQSLKSLCVISPFAYTGEKRNQSIQSYLHVELSYICLRKQLLSMEIRGANKNVLGTNTWPIQSVKSLKHLTLVWNLLQQKKAPEMSEEGEM